MSTDQRPRFMTIPDVAQELTTSDSQIRALIKTGALPTIQIGGRTMAHRTLQAGGLH